MPHQLNPTLCFAADGLTKRYPVKGGPAEPTAPKKQALDGVSFTLGPGLYGILGPDGAGKSTLVQIISGTLKPDGGSIHWCGKKVRPTDLQFRRALGCIPQRRGCYNSYTGRRFLAYLCALKEIPTKEVPVQVERVAEWVGLAHELDKGLAAYSQGMKQRLLVAGALLGDPKLLVLDEPEAGLDPWERERMWRLLERLAEDRIVLVATSRLDGVEKAAREILFLRQGKLVAQAPVESLIRTYAPGRDLSAAYRAVFDRQEDPQNSH